MRPTLASPRKRDYRTSVLAVATLGLSAVIVTLSRSNEIIAHQPDPLVPYRWEVLDATPPAGQQAQAAGPARNAGWAWRVRDPRTGMNFILVEPGEFEMGSGEASMIEDTSVMVRIAQPFYMSETEVSVGQWIRGSAEWNRELEPSLGAEFELWKSRGSPSSWRHDESSSEYPIDDVSWYDVQIFLGELNFQNEIGFDRADFYRLPSEAEWEFVCRAGTTSPFSFGTALDHSQAQFDTSLHSYSRGPAKVGSFESNSWGFFDMHGNVREWCEDAMLNETNPVLSKIDPSVFGFEYAESQAQQLAQADRASGGGDWFTSPDQCRSTSRAFLSPHERQPGFGFRVVRSIDLGTVDEDYELVPHARTGDYKSRLADLSEKFRIEILDSPEEELWYVDEAVDYSDANEYAIIQASVALAQELSRYPDHTFAARLRGIVLCGELFVDGDEAAGLFNNDGRIYLRLQEIDHSSFRKTIHHEVFHSLEGNLYTELDLDHEWRNLNSPLFEYLGDKEGLSPVISESLDGFVSSYAMKNPAEDKAETYAYMVTRTDAANARAERDTVLASKIKLLASRFRAFNF